MKNIKESCLEFFQNEDIRKDVREIIKPIVDIIYNEIYIYVWCICFFNVFLMFIILANLFILLHYVRKIKTTIWNVELHLCVFERNGYAWWNVIQ